MMVRYTRFMVVVLSAALVSVAAASGPLDERLASSSRSETDKARDAGRKPGLVVAFLGVEPGMTVLDVIAAGGYYTEVLSVAVGSEGQVYAQNNEFVLKVREGANDKAMTARLAGDRLANVTRLDAELSELPVADDSIDVAVTALNFHDIYNGRGEDAALEFLADVYRKLKPGGVLGVIDHDGLASQDNAKLHRIEKKLVLDVVAKSAFELDGQSDMLANPADDHTQGVFAPGLRGHTDRFVLRLRKPAA